MPADAPSAPVAGSIRRGGKVDSGMSDKGTSDLLPFGLGATMALLAMSSLKSRAKVSLAPAPAEKPSIEQQEVYVSIWKTVIDTQMHFNEMSVKARQFGLTFVAAALGLGVVLMSRGQEFSLSVSLFGGFEIHAIVVLVLASAFALFAVKLLDLNVYHKMLRGAVTFGEDFEEHYMKQIFSLEKGMTQAISQYSRYVDADIIEGSRPYRYTGKSRKNAAKKVALFYWVCIVTLSLLSVMLFVLTAHFGEHRLNQAAQVPAIAAPSGAPVIQIPVPGETNAK
jgi:hypothetical protein